MMTWGRIYKMIMMLFFRIALLAWVGVGLFTAPALAQAANYHQRRGDRA
jgi:hypothetical protein